MKKKLLQKGLNTQLGSARRFQRLPVWPLLLFFVFFLDDDYVFYDQQYLNLQLVLENKGAYDEPQGKVVLSGYDPTIVKLDSEPIELPDQFYGKNIYAPDGYQY